MKERIIEMLGGGIPASAVALAIGCEPSYISQLLSDPEFKEKVAAKQMDKLEQSLSSDKMIDDLEEDSLSKLKTLMPFIMKPMDALRVFQVVNAAKRKTPEVSNLGSPTAPVVQLNIPVSVAVQFKLSSDQQVVEVDGRSMSTLPNKSLQERLSERQKNRPAISDSTSANELILKIERGVPVPSIANVL